MSDGENTINLIHGSAVLLGRHGVLVRGPSGSGKSRLCHLTIREWKLRGEFARWVADDQVRLEATGCRIRMTCPPPIEGLSEQRFGGISPVLFQRQALLDVIVDLKPLAALERLPEIRSVALLAGVDPIPILSVPAERIDIGVEILGNHLREMC